MPAKVAIVAALEREVWPLIKSWPTSHKEHDGRAYKFFEKDSAVLVCGGIGAEAARRAAEAIINLYQPALIVSAGFAGGLDPAMQTGQEKLGMQTANQSLASLYMKKMVNLETALAASSNKEELQEMINRGVGVVAGAGLGRTGMPPRPAIGR